MLFVRVGGIEAREKSRDLVSRVFEISTTKAAKAAPLRGVKTAIVFIFWNSWECRSKRYVRDHCPKQSTMSCGE
jgi:hypothetical protein